MALSIYIQDTPAKALTYKMYPVYNGLPFVVSTNNFNRSNFKYIADVYVGGTKVTQLKQNKDISANNLGIFDIGRIVENFITSVSPKFQTFGFIGDNKAYQSYQIKFGAEYDRVMSFTTIYSNGGFSQLSFPSANGFNDCRIGDRILVVNNSLTTNLNGSASVIGVTSSSIKINKPYYGAASGTIIEGEGFYNNSFVTGGNVGFAIPITRPTRIQVGDTVNVIQDAGATYPGYNGEWLCTRIYNQVIGFFTYQIIVTNCPFLGNTGIQAGMIYSQNKYKYTGTTTSTLEYAFDAGLQYKDLSSWNPNNYAMNLTNKGKFLTNAPKTQYIRLDEDAKLTSFNTSIVGSSTIKKGVFKTYNSAGSLVNTYSTNLAGSAVSVAVLNTGVGTKNLVTLNANALNGIESYTFEYQNVTGGTVSEVRKYIIDRQCFRYTQKRFKWKNRMGGWDFFTFNLRSDRTVQIERSNFRKFQNSYNLTTSKYGYSIGDRGNSTYNVNARDSEMVYSNWLNNDEAAWLEELFTSPEAYILDGTNELPIILTDTALTIGEKENRGLISYSINYDYAYNKVIQRG